MRWEKSAMLSDYLPCQPSDVEYVMTSLSRVPFLADWQYVDDTQRVVWTLMDAHIADAACQHLCVKRHVLKAISTHTAQDWQP